jgi:hypothetical protein
LLLLLFARTRRLRAGAEHLPEEVFTQKKPLLLPLLLANDDEREEEE